MPEVEIWHYGQKDEVPPDSEMFEVLTRGEVSWKFKRFPELDELRKRCQEAAGTGVKIIILIGLSVASLAAVTRGIKLLSIPVIGVSLTEPKSFPWEYPIAYLGFGEDGLTKAAIFALTLLAMGEDIVSQQRRKKVCSLREERWTLRN